jgi:hypothetical protein
MYYASIELLGSEVELTCEHHIKVSVPSVPEIDAMHTLLDFIDVLAGSQSHES